MQPTSQVPKSVVYAWFKKAKSSFGIRSIICLLDQRQLRLYLELKMDLISYDRASGDRPGPLVLPLFGILSLRHFGE
jgi:hypothetical protein